MESLKGARALPCLGCQPITVPSYSLTERHILEVVAVCMGSLSICLGIITLRPLWALRRSFRHQLIALLIISQLSKTFWLWIYPIIKLGQGTTTQERLQDGPTAVSVGLCYADGFLFSYGSEAADFIILMIAIHSMLSIFRPRACAEKSGLYPYRSAVFCGWVIWPTLSASLAFINKDSAYTPQSAYCYLPIRPFWYRLALAWIPRYFVLLTIVGAYAAIYFYVRNIFNDLTSRMSNNNTLDGVSAPSKSLRNTAEAGLRWSQQPGPNKALETRHKEIEKQLRQMFIYPVIYLLMFIPPFAAHCWSYSARLAPFPLGCASLVCLTLQCAVDCLVFTRHEKVHNPSVESYQVSRPSGRPVSLMTTFSAWTEAPKAKARVSTISTAESIGQQVHRESRNWWDLDEAHERIDNSRENRLLRMSARRATGLRS